MFNFPFLDTKNINMKYSRVIIGKNSGKPIKEAILKAEKFIYIISPYFDEDSISFLNSLNKNLDIKLIFSDSYNFLQNNASKLKQFFKYSENQTITEERIKIWTNLQSKLKTYSILRKIFLPIFFTSLILFLCVYLKKFFPIQYKMPSLIVSGVSLFLILLFKDLEKMAKIRANKDFYIKKQTIIPDVEWNPKFKTKIIKSSYSTNGLNTPFPHLKIFLIDSPDLSNSSGKNITQVFIGSANFTSKGFYNNIECLFSTSDLNVTEQVHSFFNEMYYCNNFHFYTKDEIAKVLFEQGILKHDNDQI